jgi:hypothetical protein
LTGVTKEDVFEDKLLVRWRDAKVEPKGFDEFDMGPETERVEEDTVDNRLVDLLGVLHEPEVTRPELGCAGERNRPRPEPRVDGFRERE